MKTFLLRLLIFVFGFIIGAGVGFKVLEGVSTDLVVQAWENSATQFQAQYPSSTAKRNIDAYIAKQKDALIAEIQGGLKDYVVSFLKGVGSQAATGDVK